MALHHWVCEIRRRTDVVGIYPATGRASSASSAQASPSSTGARAEMPRYLSLDALAEARADNAPQAAPDVVEAPAALEEISARHQARGSRESDLVRHFRGRDPIGPAERMDHLHLPPATRGVPRVMRHPHALHPRAVPARLPRSRSRLHAQGIRPNRLEASASRRIFVSRQSRRLQPRMLLSINGNPRRRRDH